MILNDQQLSVAQRHLGDLTTWISELKSAVNASSDQFLFLELRGLEGFATDIQREIKEYKTLREGTFTSPPPTNLSDLPVLLIQTRIARGWSQEKLADNTNTKVATMQQYEENAYLGASLSKLMEVAQALDIDTSGVLRHTYGDSVVSSRETPSLNLGNFDWGKFPVEEAFDRGWIHDKFVKNRTEAFKTWFVESTGPYTVSALHSKRNNCTVQANEPSILAWQARILQIANDELNGLALPEFKGDDRWIKYLTSVTMEPDGPTKVKELLREQGILLIIEPHLPQTYLDGATLQTHDGAPIIALTLRRDRLDYFWFTLFHELGHLYCHLFSRLNNGFIDLDVLQEEKLNDPSISTVDDDLESEADDFASEWLIKPSAWDTCLSRYSTSPEAVSADAQRLNIHPSIIAGRIRYEQNHYEILNDLVGHGQLQRHFPEYFPQRLVSSRIHNPTTRYFKA